MTGSTVPLPAPDAPPGRALHAFAVLVAASTFLLIFAGGLVTSTGSGLAVPDWPLSFGQFFPPMQGGVLFEHGHRMIAAAVGFLTLVLAVWIWIREPRPVLRRLAGVALFAVVAQAVLGGVTVLLKLPIWVSVSHACVAQAFFCMVILLAVFTGRGRSSSAGITTAGRGDPWMVRMAVLTTGVIFLQLLLGAIVRHMGSGLAIPDFPLAFGRLIPPLRTAGVAVHFLHRAGALIVTLCFAITAVALFRRHRRNMRMVRPALLCLVLLALQIGLGASIIWLQRPVIPTTAHVAVGAGLLSASLVLTIRAFQLNSPAAGDRGEIA